MTVRGYPSRAESIQDDDLPGRRRTTHPTTTAPLRLVLAVAVLARLHAFRLPRHLRIVGWVRRVLAPVAFVPLQQHAQVVRRVVDTRHRVDPAAHPGRDRGESEVV